jgi:membrane fusion protein (multidrug efflux system)
MPEGSSNPSEGVALRTPGPRTRGLTPAARLGLIGAIGGLLLLALVFGIEWFAHGQFIQGTDDAYLQADAMTVAPKVQGYVDRIFVTDNQSVVVGQPLLKIDPSTYQASFAQQIADAKARQAAIEAADAQIDQQEKAIAQAQAQFSGAQASLAYARGEAQRFRRLNAEGVESAERAAQQDNSERQALATAQADAAALAQAQKTIGTLKAQRAQAQAQFAGAQAQVDNARLNLGDTILRAAITGRIGDKTVQIGQFVQPGARLMSVVPVSQIYLVANFKETQLRRMRIGQPARVKIDAVGDRTLEAVVDSFSPGTGATFALLPPQNATGNFTKIVQRVPVRLRLRVPQDLSGRLLSGLSASVTVDTSKPGQGA